MKKSTLSPLRIPYIVPLWAFALILALLMADQPVLAAVGDVIQLDLDGSLAAAPPPGGNWNTIIGSNLNSTVSNLIEFNSGIPTTVSYTGAGWNNGIQNSSVWIAGDIDWVVNDAADDGASVSNSVAIITLGGLPGSNYMVELVSASYIAGDVADFTIGGSFANRSYNCTSGSNSRRYKSDIMATRFS